MPTKRIETLVLRGRPWAEVTELRGLVTLWLCSSCCCFEKVREHVILRAWLLHLSLSWRLSRHLRLPCYTRLRLLIDHHVLHHHHHGLHLLKHGHLLSILLLSWLLLSHHSRHHLLHLKELLLLGVPTSSLNGWLLSLIMGLCGDLSRERLRTDLWIVAYVGGLLCLVVLLLLLLKGLSLLS